jgi:tetratricopeptide (TPR) repeat protein
MKKIFPAIICVLVVRPVLWAQQQAPLANANKAGLYARSIEQVLQLKEDQVDLATAVLIVSENWSDMVNGRYYLRELDEMAREIRDRLEQRKIGMGAGAIPVINDYLFDELGFKSIPEASDPGSLFLHTVMDKRRGYCLSLSILYLAIGERLGLPLYGVVVPGHFFVRYDDGRTRFNIETTSKGATAPDSHYIARFKVPIGDNNLIYMKNLTKKQTLGCFFNNLGNSYGDVDNMNSALLAFERAVALDPTLSESRANLGNIYLEKYRLDKTKKDLIDKAISEYEAALQFNPRDARTHNNLGNAYMQAGSLNYAVLEYLKSIDLDPNFVDAYKNLALVYSKQTRYGQAIAQLSKALHMAPGDAGCYSQLGDVYDQMGDYEEAIAQFKNALKLKPDLVEAHYGLATCYNKLGLVDDEILEYKRVLALKPDMVAALVNLGNAYFRRGKYDAAIELYKMAARIQPKEAMVYYNLGAAYSKNKDFEQAVAAYLKAVTIDPNIGDAHYGLAFGYYQLKKYRLAWKHMKIAQQLGANVTQDQLNAIKSRLR